MNTIENGFASGTDFGDFAPLRSEDLQTENHPYCPHCWSRIEERLFRVHWVACTEVLKPAHPIQLK